MPKLNVLNAVTGFKEAITIKDELAKTGSDFTDQKWATANTIAKLHPKRLTLEVSEVIEETETTKTFRLVSTGGALPPFQAGQYINLFVEIDGVETARPYAISSSSSQREYYDLTVKRVPDGFVTHYLLDNVEAGQQFLSTGPMGTFYHNPVFHGKDLIFLAGGSGIAPAMSMLKEVFDRELDYQFHFIYASSYVDDVIFIEELRTLAQQHQNFTLTEVISRPPENYQGLTGHLNAELIQNLVGDVKQKMFYVCGPTAFHDFCQSQLLDLGVPPRRVRIEANGPPKHPDQFSNWPEAISMNDEVTVTVKGKGSFKAKVGEPLLNSLERNGYSAENACRSGECSLCRVKLVSGEVFNPPEAHLRVSDQQFGWIHSCVAFPTEDVEIIL
ncbi:flavodoxin reductase [Gammaproteobacteria bacterium 45_16_T64]|nr:flavodoxin reductase [Gammaproteobacteria bacterium 45_16_T64]